MPTTYPTHDDLDEMRRGLAAWAAGETPLAGAVGLLCGHRTLLPKLAAAVLALTVEDGWAVVFWDEVDAACHDGRVVLSSSEATCLAIVLNLAGAAQRDHEPGPYPVELAGLAGLDQYNRALVLAALAAAAGDPALTVWLDDFAGQYR